MRCKAGATRFKLTAIQNSDDLNQVGEHGPARARFRQQHKHQKQCANPAFVGMNGAPCLREHEPAEDRESYGGYEALSLALRLPLYAAELSGVRAL